MQTNDKLESIKNRIQALSEMTIENGCTEAEAMTAMKMIGRLLSEYNLSMSDVHFKDEEFVLGFVDTQRYNQNAMKYVVVGIGKFTDSKVWFVLGRPMFNRTTIYNFFGTKPDVEMAIFLYKLISNALETETNRFKAASGGKKQYGVKKSASTSFSMGFINRINHRLQELKAENDVDVSMSNGTSLMVLKGQLVDENYAKMIQEQDLKMKKGTGQTRIKDPKAYMQGQAAANNVNLGRPVNDGSGHQLLLK